MFEFSKVAIQSSRDYLTATIQSEISEPMLSQFQADLLAKIALTQARGVVIDLSGVSVIDQVDFLMLLRIVKMVSLMGVSAILTGFQPGVVSYLVESEIDLIGFEACLTLDGAVRRLDKTLAAKASAAKNSPPAMASASGDDEPNSTKALAASEPNSTKAPAANEPRRHTKNKSMRRAVTDLSQVGGGR